MTEVGYKERASFETLVSGPGWQPPPPCRQCQGAVHHYGGILRCGDCGLPAGTPFKRRNLLDQLVPRLAADQKPAERTTAPEPAPAAGPEPKAEEAGDKAHGLQTVGVRESRRRR